MLVDREDDRKQGGEMKTFDRSRWLQLAILVATLGVLLVGAGPAGGDSGASVAQRLGDAGKTVGSLSGSVGENGAYEHDNSNASSVPFLGGGPGSLLPDLFDALGPLSEFDNFSPSDDDPIKVVKDKVDSVDTALGGDALHRSWIRRTSAATPPAPTRARSRTSARSSSGSPLAGRSRTTSTSPRCTCRPSGSCRKTLSSCVSSSAGRSTCGSSSTRVVCVSPRS